MADKAVHITLLPERVQKKIAPMPDGCWLWTASLQTNGYGQLGGRDKKGSYRPLLAHRVVYEALVGEIPEGLTIDHLCRERTCVNPNHLEPVTMLVNVRRGGNSIKTHCKWGHSLEDALAIRWNGRVTGRRCRTCNKRRCREYARRTRKDK